MFHEWLNTALGPLKVKIWLAILAALALLAWAVVEIVDNAVEDTIDTAKDAGASGAVVEGHETTFGQLKDANDAEQEIKRGGERNAARYADCLRNNRRAGACERFRPPE